MKELVEEEEKIASYKGNQLPDDVLKQAKKDGFADKYISKILDIEEKEIRNQRLANGYASSLGTCSCIKYKR